MGVPSPCISICAMDEVTGFCKGCYRTIEEVASWLYYTDEQKTQVLENLRQRKPASK
jgi:predicted Fe-S protein YdhL (DUF1289 family)